jgi:phage shock protein C
MSSPHVDQPRTEPGQARLVRSRDDRMIAGVAGGIGRYLGIDPVIVRILFVVLALAGGGGLLAYLIAWVVVPEEGEGEEALPRSAGTGSSALAGVVLIALGALLLADRLLPIFSWRYVGPALLIALGVLLLARKGDDR